MTTKYIRGLAFICEGQTEKEFYECLIRYYCEQYGLRISIIKFEYSEEIAWEIERVDGVILIMFDNAECITNITKSGRWFTTQCVKKHKTSWRVFLCYDTDGYSNPITPFYEGYWLDLRKELKHGATIIVDLAAKADIEDVLLIDYKSVLKFLGSEYIPLPEGKKGKRKMEKLFRLCGHTYHSGCEARYLIDNLDLPKIICSRVLPLEEVKKALID